MVGSGVDAGFIVTLYGFVGVVFVAVVVRVPCVVPSGEWSARSHQLGMPNILNPHGHIDAGATECADWQELWCAWRAPRK